MRNTFVVRVWTEQVRNIEFRLGKHIRIDLWQYKTRKKPSAPTLTLPKVPDDLSVDHFEQYANFVNDIESIVYDIDCGIYAWTPEGEQELTEDIRWIPGWYKAQS